MEYVEDEFDKDIQLNISTDICAFCRRDHSWGCRLDNVLDDQEAALRGDDNGEKADIVKYIGETESWFNIKKEIIRSRGLLCKHCNLRGATLGCYYPSCNYVVHIPCAVNSGEWNPKAYHNIIDSEFFCSKHFHLQQERIMQKDEKFGNDISRGKEVLAIPWKGDKDYSYVDNMPSGYEYITENLDSDDVNVSLRDIESLPCCDCVDECTDLFSCSCLRGHLNYDKNGNLINLNSEVSFGYDLTIFECNAGCACSKRRCQNRVVGNGLSRKLQVVKDNSISKGRLVSGNAGWTVKAIEDIPTGAFVCEVVGQYVQGGTRNYNSETKYTIADCLTAADEENLIFPVGQFLEKFGKPGRWRGTGEVTWWAREKVREMDKGKVLVGEERSDTQMSALSDNELISEFLTGQLCIDCRHYGNISRFMKQIIDGSDSKEAVVHDSGMLPRLIYMDSREEAKATPRLAFFAGRKIPAGSDLII